MKNDGDCRDAMLILIWVTLMYIAGLLAELNTHFGVRIW